MCNIEKNKGKASIINLVLSGKEILKREGKYF
jgi:hypothetical protein